MNFRELLQTEIWSKGTSRKILARVRKVLVRVGIVFGALAVVFGTVYVIEISWMTAGERKIATTALPEIDTLQNFVTADGNDFETRDQQAKETVMAAARAARTIRDNRVSGLLWEYLGLTESDRRMAKLSAQIRSRMQQRNIPWQSHPTFNGENDAREIQTRLMFRSAALKELH
jgi:hypothetical protein